MFSVSTPTIGPHSALGAYAVRERIVVRKTTANSETKKRTQAQHRAWLRWLSSYAGRSLSKLGLDAGLSDQSTTRIFRQDYAGTLSSQTIAALKTTYDVPGPDSDWKTLDQQDASPLDISAIDDSSIMPLVKAALASYPTAEAWAVNTASLRSAGIMPGDVLIVAANIDPQDGDIVCAETFDRSRNRTVFVWRVYRDGYLITGDLDAPIDARVATISGVVLASLSPRQGKQVV